MRQPNKEPDWKLVEKIAALLEKSLAPTARVEHNVRLPVLGQPKRKPRQCDIVITYRDASRQTIAIAEVQKRNRKPNITTFHGWIQKMREVGAQQLICISALGYPQSIIDEVATRHGPTIMLLTLEELQQTTIPGLAFARPFAVHKSPSFSFASIDVKFQNPPSIESLDLEIRVNDRIFEFDDTCERLNLIELATQAFDELSSVLAQKGLSESNSYMAEFVMPPDGRDLWLCLHEQRLKLLELHMKVNVETRVTKIPLTCFAYRQEFVDGALAWVVSAKGAVSKGEVTFQLVFKPNQQGFLQLVSAWQQGAESVVLELYGDEMSAMTAIARHMSNSSNG